MAGPRYKLLATSINKDVKGQMINELPDLPFDEQDAAECFEKSLVFKYYRYKHRIEIFELDLLPFEDTPGMANKNFITDISDLDKEENPGALFITGYHPPSM